MMPRNGGRPRVYPICPLYRKHRFTSAQKCPCGYTCEQAAKARAAYAKAKAKEKQESRHA